MQAKVSQSVLPLWVSASDKRVLAYRIMETAEEEDSGDTAVSELRSELWEKERELTDIRLEALSSAHQLEQLREAMNNMEVCFAGLRASVLYVHKCI